MLQNYYKARHLFFKKNLGVKDKGRGSGRRRKITTRVKLSTGCIKNYTLNGKGSTPILVVSKGSVSSLTGTMNQGLNLALEAKKLK